MLREPILAASRSAKVKELITKTPITGAVVKRFVAGESVQNAVDTVAGLRSQGLLATIDHLGEDVTSIESARINRDAYLSLLAEFKAHEFGGSAEVSVKLSAIGQALAGKGEDVSFDFAREICIAAAAAGTTVTIDMEDHTTTDMTLRAVRELRKEFPWVGAVLQSYLVRTENDCQDLAYEGSRVRLCKGAYKEPPSVAFQDKKEVDRSYVRCMSILMAGAGYPMLATHDPRIIEIAGALARRNNRAQGSYEHQMLLGIRPDEQIRLAAEGEKMRVYVPFGTDWYGYLMRRMAEKPANLVFFLRALATRG
ncbi:proline dehydrogenase 1 [mine drainage metagenome]|uniref:proline dehydrogenase n=1 Tax=mine drainage metagenome TaxID=410659 RepID=A0A1J5QBR7_9ZZZZ